MIWWLLQPSRARAERAAIAELEERVSWLTGVTWGLESECRLAANFVIHHLNDEFQLKLVYPSFFPDTPPQVVPRENVRLSNHQWGEGGELCLELRADNWDTAFTGAMMIESAYSLLSGERPATDERATVPSAHRVTQAQSIRGDRLRFLLTVEEHAALQDIAVGEVIELALSEHIYNKHWLIHPVRLGPKEAPAWTRAQRVVDGSLVCGFALRLPLSRDLPRHLDGESLGALLASVAADKVIEALDAGSGSVFLLLIRDNDYRLFCSYVGSKGRVVFAYTTVLLPEGRNRLPDSHAFLADKSVAIIGCGSMGSKVAVSLARAGVTKFTLIDQDTLNPDNLVRNDLDARAVGVHKVDAVAARIIEVNIDADLSMRRIKLGGQESAGSTDSALRDIAKADLIIDATADPYVFNLCASVARSERKAMLWGEVFAGGIGGLIARVRPDLEPPPHAARRQLLAWCEAQGVPWNERPAVEYGLDRQDAPPLIADDADVAVIAAHLTRLALDTLLYGSESRFPQSAYVIGLARGWIFSAPFDTCPIAFSAEGLWGPNKDPDAAEQLKTLASELFPDLKQQATDAA